MIYKLNYVFKYELYIGLYTNDIRLYKYIYYANNIQTYSKYDLYNQTNNIQTFVTFLNTTYLNIQII